MIENLNIDEHISLLLKKFNKRDAEAFAYIYSHFYDDFYRYASYLYYETSVDAKDIVHDTFIKIWIEDNIQFESLEKLRSFAFVLIKNNFINYKNRNKLENDYIIKKKTEFDFDLFECEIYSIAEKAYNMLPEECGKVFRLYIDGYKPDDIAKKLGKSTQTVYNMKQQAITILRKKLGRYKLSVIYLLFHCFYS